MQLEHIYFSIYITILISNNYIYTNLTKFGNTGNNFVAVLIAELSGKKLLHCLMLLYKTDRAGSEARFALLVCIFVKKFPVFWHYAEDPGDIIPAAPHHVIYKPVKAAHGISYSMCRGSPVAHYQGLDIIVNPAAVTGELFRSHSSPEVIYG